ncbi:GNAT family N-acetyltransferase [Pseudarthrobacter sulfonivorans]|uniref:GNAT family N-acetyltransferase n=1 Tax=Pseudarthrobacter sulfonivorans TaxID=121292 RepID=UPI00210559B1|nr:GNAT family N-acetyltransferase [Pseudarthrobacter sulfonivorans]
MEIREVTADDLHQVQAVCDASGRERWTEDSIIPRSDRLVLAAVTAGGIIGVAKTHFHPDPDGAVPAGHYLGGIVVVPGFRRQGVGAALTRARMEWIWARAASAYYFANEHNDASITMHEVLGFHPVARFAEIHGVTADHGESELILFEAAR